MKSLPLLHILSLFIFTIFFAGCNTEDTNNNTKDTPVIIIADMQIQMSDTLKMYYSTALDKNSTALKSALHTIIKTSTFYTYAQAYNLLDETDKDINNRDESKVILFYARQSVLAIDKCHTISPDGCWNREHLWPKSLGVGYNENIACYTDLHHLRPSLATINADRSNRRFSESSTPYTQLEGFYYDDSAYTWEVSDALKGDVARVMFYMAVRYEGENGEPDLELLAHDNSATRPAELCEMLAWNAIDPVSGPEIRRNDNVYKYQKNRNPFIDNPQWAEDIWKEECK